MCVCVRQTLFRTFSSERSQMTSVREYVRGVYSLNEHLHNIYDFVYHRSVVLSRCSLFINFQFRNQRLMLILVVEVSADNNKWNIFQFGRTFVYVGRMFVLFCEFYFCHLSLSFYPSSTTSLPPTSSYSKTRKWACWKIPDQPILFFAIFFLWCNAQISCTQNCNKQ